MEHSWTRATRSTPFTACSRPANRAAFVLSGRGAQLGNKGGTITLKDRAGVQVHAVSYSKEDAAREDRYVRFTT